MDRREAIDILVGVIATNSEEENEALDLAIEALGRTDTDCISRQQAVEAVTNTIREKFSLADWYEQLVETGLEIENLIKELPPVNKKNAEIATSESEESTMGQPKSKLYIPLNEYTVDRINRLHKNDCGDYFDEEWLYNELEQIAEILQLSPETSTNDLISRQTAIEALTGWETDPTDEEIVHTLKALPPVEPKRPKGEWKLVDHLWECDCCQYRQNKSKPTNFCPNCGCDCRGDKE